MRYPNPIHQILTIFYFFIRTINVQPEAWQDLNLWYPIITLKGFIVLVILNVSEYEQICNTDMKVEEA